MMKMKHLNYYLRYTYADKGHKDLTRVLIFIVDHGLRNRNLCARPCRMQIALYTLHQLRNVRLGNGARISQIGRQRCGIDCGYRTHCGGCGCRTLAQLRPILGAKHGGIRLIHLAQMTRHAAVAAAAANGHQIEP